MYVNALADQRYANMSLQLRTSPFLPCKDPQNGQIRSDEGIGLHRHIGILGVDGNRRLIIQHISEAANR
jgi:hypothetical protein